MAAVKVGVLSVLISSFKGHAGEEFLLLEQVRGRRWGKCPLAVLSLGRITVSTYAI